MKLNQKETQLITELQNQEQICITKYDFYAEQAHDSELKNLFKRLADQERAHLNMLKSLMDGKIPKIAEPTPLAEDYNPKESNTASKAHKEFDKFLCTDIIATEKYVATDYNHNLFFFASTDVRNVLNAIMTDEQNHAEMIWKYKVANKMVA